MKKKIVPQKEAETAMEPEFTLYMLPSGKAILACLLGNESLAKEIAPRYVKILVVLVQAYQLDIDMLANLRGLRSSLTIANKHKPNRSGNVPRRGTISTYLNDLRDELKTSDPAGKAFPPLIHNIPKTGARLIYPIKIQGAGGLDSDG